MVVQNRSQGYLTGVEDVASDVHNIKRGVAVVDDQDQTFSAVRKPSLNGDTGPVRLIGFKNHKLCGGTSNSRQ